MNSKSHKFITKAAIELNNLKLTKDEMEILTDGALAPDFDENVGGYKYHFYNPVTRKNFRGERISALTKFIEHYNNHKESKTIKQALDELGRSLHYLEDLCTPVHTYYTDSFDSVYRLPQHIEFECMCDDLTDDINYKLIKIDTGYYKLNSIKTIGKSKAMTASIEFSEYVDCDKKHIPKVCKQALVNAIEASTGILYKSFVGGKIWQTV